jgi:hypothetical protein
MSSFSSNHKRPTPRSIGPSKRFKASSSDGHFLRLSPDLRKHVLTFLTADDLASVAPVCKTVRKDCRDPSLSQSRTATINIPARDHFFWERLFAALQRMEKRGIFQRFDKLKIAGFRFGPVVLTQAGRIRDARYLRRVKVLDMSSPADMALSTGEHGDFSSLVMSMPSIQEVDFSHSCAPVSALRYLTLSCKWLKKLTWEESRCSLTSSLLFAGVCQELKEVYIDGSTLECDDPSEIPHCW